MKPPSLRIMLALAVLAAPSLAQRPATLPVPTTGQFTIAGTVAGAIGGAPLSRARVFIVDDNDRQKQRSMVTGDDGQFSFPKVPAGKYALAGAKRGYIAAGYDEHEQFSTAIVTGAGLDTEHLSLRLKSAAILSGKVLDEAGEPVRDASVALYREDHRSGVNRILRASNQQTDDLGAYEFSSLAPGTYFVSATATPWYAVHAQSSGSEPSQPTSVDPSLDVAYLPTYYEDSSEPDEAVPVPVAAGDRTEVTIHLVPVPSLHLRFREPDNGQGFSLPNLQRPSLDGMDFVQTNGAQLISPGLWEINGVAAGKYVVSVPSQRAGTGGEMEMNITSDGEELDTAKAEMNGSVNAKVALAGGGAIPSDMSLELLNGKDRPVSGMAVDAKGEASIANVAPGEYSFHVVGPNKDYSVVAVADQQHVARGRSINVTAGATIQVSLTVAEGSATVEGFARADGKPAAGAMIVLVPDKPEANRELFRRDQSDLDGSFALRNVVPGSYTAVAIQDGWELDWSSPPVIAYYAKHGQAVTISAGKSGSQHLANPLEVQSK